MNTLIICGSPKKGSSEMISEKLAIALQKNKKNSVETVLLREKNLLLCTGCLLCEDKAICPLNDDMENIVKQIINSDNMVIVTPVYFDNVPAILKNLLDRTNILASSLKGKKVYLITVGQADASSWINCSNFIRNYCDILEMKYLGANNLFARKPEDLTEEIINNAIESFYKNVSN